MPPKKDPFKIKDIDPFKNVPGFFPEADVSAGDKEFNSVPNVSVEADPKPVIDDAVDGLAFGKMPKDWKMEVDPTLMDGGKIYPGTIDDDSLTIGFSPNLTPEKFASFEYFNDGEDVGYDEYSGGTPDLIAVTNTGRIILFTGFSGTNQDPTPLTWYVTYDVAYSRGVLYIGGRKVIGDPGDQIHEVEMWTGGIVSSITTENVSDNTCFTFWDGNLYCGNTDITGFYVQKYSGFSATPVGDKLRPTPTGLSGVVSIAFDESGNLCLLSYTAGVGYYFDRFSGYSVNVLGTPWGYLNYLVNYRGGLDIFEGDVIVYRTLQIGGPNGFIRHDIDDGTFIDSFGMLLGAWGHATGLTNTSGGGNLGQAATTYYEGGKSVKFSGPVNCYLGSSATDYNCVVEGGTKYILSAYVKAVSGTPNVDFGVKFNNDASISKKGDFAVSTDWQRFSYVFTTAAATTAIEIVIENTTGVTYWDCVQVEKANSSATDPDPSGWKPPSLTTRQLNDLSDVVIS